MISATFRFHGALNDFLPRLSKEQWIHRSYETAPSLKDALEAIGVPHTEIGRVERNRAAIELTTKIKHGDSLEVFPFIVQHGLAPRFILDVHLGKLARLLRLMGFDTIYDNGYEDATIAARAQCEDRIVLTRDIGLLKHSVIRHGHWLRSQLPQEQLREVSTRFGLLGREQPFSRCIACNGSIAQVDKEDIASLLPPQTAQYYQHYYQCAQCRKIYWKGSHYNRMEAMVDRFRS